VLTRIAHGLKLHDPRNRERNPLRHGAQAFKCFDHRSSNRSIPRRSDRLARFQREKNSPRGGASNPSRLIALDRADDFVLDRDPGLFGIVLPFAETPGEVRADTQTVFSRRFRLAIVVDDGFPNGGQARIVRDSRSRAFLRRHGAEGSID